MTPHDASESERRTRRARIDPRLRACGWQIVRFSPHKPLTAYDHHAIEEYPTANGPADYALVVDGQLLGVVEAKKVTLGPQNVLTQAERYSKGIDGAASSFGGYGVPFLYASIPPAPSEPTISYSPRRRPGVRLIWSARIIRADSASGAERLKSQPRAAFSAARFSRATRSGHRASPRILDSSGSFSAMKR